MTKFNKGTGYNITTPKPAVFLYANNESSENKLGRPSHLKLHQKE